MKIGGMLHKASNIIASAKQFQREVNLVNSYKLPMCLSAVVIR